MPTEELFLSDTLSYGKALTVLKDSNLTNFQINEFMWGLLNESTGKQKRVFNYNLEFKSDHPDCEAKFNRSFIHIDWIDGESVVQAETNTVEDGFNLRFHRIENDLDALSTDVRKAFECIGDMRGELADRLSEIKVELNRINTDIFQKTEDSGGGFWTGPFIPDQPIPTFPLPDRPRPWPGFPRDPRGPRPGWPGTIRGDFGTRMFFDSGETPWEVRRGGLAGMIEGLGSTPQFEGTTVTRDSKNPDRATVAGMMAHRLDIKNMNGKNYEVWSTQSGLVLTPTSETVTPAKAEKRRWDNPQLEDAAVLSEWVAKNEREIGAKFNNAAFSVAQLNKAFGGERIAGGKTVSDALEYFPSGMKFARPAEFVDAVTEKAASAIARGGLGTETLVANLGLNLDVKDVNKAPVRHLKNIPPKARTVLEQNNVSTVAQLNKVTPLKLARLMAQNNIRTTPAEALGETRVLAKLGKKLG